VVRISKQDRFGSRGMEEHDGLGFVGGRGGEDGEVAVWMEAPVDF